MGNSQNLKQSQQESQDQKIKMITQETQNQSQTNQSQISQNSFNEGENKIKQNYLLIQDELTSATIIKPHQFNLSFEIKSLFQQVSIQQKQKQKIPATIDVSTNGIPFKQFRGGIDLICVIDVSESMKGDKIKLLKQTLLKLLDQLEQKDRLCLIIFNDKVEVLTALKKITLKNKLIFQKVIHDITASGGTNIYDALEKALIQLIERKQLNPNTSLFLLSDGWDYKTKQKFHELFQDNLTYFTLNCFGFGTDHDPELLQKISSLFSGVYYNVTEIHQLEKYFLEALGHAMTSDGSQIEISVNCLSNEIFQDEVEIQKIYSKKWNPIDAKKKYKIIIPLVGEASVKSFVFELQLPIPEKSMVEQQKDVAVLFASISMISPITHQAIAIQTSLILTIINYNGLAQTSPFNSNVALIYYQTKCTEKIQKAEKLCDRNKFEDARSTLKKTIAQINSDDAVAAQCSTLVFELTQALIEVDKVENGIYSYHKKTYISNKQIQQEIVDQYNENQQKRHAQTSIQQNKQFFEQNNKRKIQDQYL